MTHEPLRQRRWSRVATVSIAVAIPVGAILTGAYATLSGPRSEPGRPYVLSVSATAAQPLTGYRAQHLYTGRVEARRSSEVGFEQAGLITEILVDEGDRVVTGQLLARIDTAAAEAERAELEAELARTRAQLKLARITHKRLSGMLTEGASSQQAVDDAREGLVELEAAERLARARLQTNAVRLSKSELRSPYDAIVVRRMVDEGRVIDAGQAMLQLHEQAAPEARIGMAGNTSGEFRPEQMHTIQVNGLPIAARVKTVLPVRSAAQRTVDVIFELPADLTGTHPGDLVTVVAAEDVATPGYWVPVEALAEAARGLWSVYVAEPLTEPDASRARHATHRLETRLVELVYQESERVYVRGTLTPGDLIVTKGLHKLVPGQSVRLVASASAPAPG